VLLLLIPLRDDDSDGSGAAYEHALRLFQQGRLPAARAEAETGWARYRQSERAGDFQLLYARSLFYLGQGQDALNLLAQNPDPGATDDDIQRLALEASIYTQLGQPQTAEQRIKEAETICRRADFVACAGVLTSRGSLTRRLGEPETGRVFYERAFVYARNHRDPWRQVSAAVTLGFWALQGDHPDEAVDWSRIAYQLAVKQGYDDAAQNAAGNLGFAYYQLGDGERALEQFEQAEKAAAELGDFEQEIWWVSDAAYVYRDQGDFSHAEELNRKALVLAQKISNREEEGNALGDLAALAISTGKLSEADDRLQEALRIEKAARGTPRPIFVLMQAQLAAARHDYATAEGMFHAVLSDAASPMAVRLNAGSGLAELYERMGRTAAAERMYKTTIDAWEAARAGLKHEESELSFGANATEIYDNYIRLLVREGRTGEALAVADRSRARTLAEGLGIDAKHLDGHSEALHPEGIARKAGAALLFYWLGAQESYLWAITPQKTAFFRLPAANAIAAQVVRYNRTTQNPNPAARDGEPDVSHAANPDGMALYAELVEPAAKTLAAETAKRPVIVLSDGALSGLNFETLLVPGANSGQNGGGKPHYLIEDWTILSAPSLDLLAHGASELEAHASQRDSTARSLLLIGNPVAADPDFPPLPLFGAEMRRVRSHFGAQDASAIEGAQATPAAYAAANPGSFAYIHFVSHATASRTAPLDSAIILSNPSLTNPAAGGDPVSAYKLYAREIVAHSLTARLVTVSACYGSGTRAYAGEGLIGLSWAFLRAGARQVVSALWEVSDESTPRLMDGLYAGIQAGKTPAAALRDAKLALLHSGTRFRQPFYWAPFQIYSRE
jgi:CHAT domain-containing protein